MGIADYVRDAGKCGEIFGCALSVTAGDDDAGLRIGGVDFADGVTGLRVGGSSNCAGVDDDEFSGGWIGSDRTALIAELALDGGAVSLRGATAELFDVEGGHWGNEFG